MTIRWQIFAFVVPLFCVVAAAGSAIAFWLETTTIRNALVDQAHGLSVAVAEFTEPADVAELKQGIPLNKTRLGAAATRLQHWPIVKRLFLIDTGSNRLLADTAPAGTPVPAAPVPALGKEEVRMLPMRVTPDGHSLLPVLALAANGAAIVGVEISADDFLRQKRFIWYAVVRGGVIVTLLGVGVGSLLGLLLSRPIRRLGAAVDKIGTPEFSDSETDSVIQEVADLGNTLGVMHSVLGETEEKERRALLESDHYRSESGLTATYQAALQPPAVWSGAGADAAWLPIGAPPPAALAAALALQPSCGAAFAGIAGPEGELEAAVRARAAGAFLADALGRQTLAAAAAETQSLFGLSQLVVVRWRDGALECWPPGGAAHADAPDPAAWSAGRPVALACLGAVNRRRLGLYLANFSRHGAKQMLAELPPWLDSAESGVVLVLRRRG